MPPKTYSIVPLFMKATRLQSRRAYFRDGDVKLTMAKLIGVIGARVNERDPASMDKYSKIINRAKSCAFAKKSFSAARSAKNPRDEIRASNLAKRGGGDITVRCRRILAVLRR